MTLTFMLFPALASMITAVQTGQSFVKAAGFVAGWLLNANSEQSAEAVSGFGFLAVMATLVIGIAFSLPSEGVQTLPRKSRELIGVLTVGVVLVVSLFSAALMWVILWRQVTFELVLLLVSAWLVSVVAGLVELKRPAEERLSDAKREREELRDGAKASGFTEQVTTTNRRKIGAEVAYWLIPIVGVPVLGGAGLIWDFRGFQVDSRAWAVLFVLWCGSVLASAAWRATAPSPPYKLSDQVVSWIGKSGGLVLMVLAALGGVLARSWGFATLSALAIVVAAALYVLPGGPSRFPFMKTIRDAATLKRLTQADEWYATVSRELDHERTNERSAPLSVEAEREPVIRIEVFRRRSRRRLSEGIADAGQPRR